MTLAGPKTGAHGEKSGFEFMIFGRPDRAKCSSAPMNGLMPRSSSFLTGFRLELGTVVESCLLSKARCDHKYNGSSFNLVLNYAITSSMLHLFCYD